MINDLQYNRKIKETCTAMGFPLNGKLVFTEMLFGKTRSLLELQLNAEVTSGN